MKNILPPQAILLKTQVQILFFFLNYIFCYICIICYFVCMCYFKYLMFLQIRKKKKAGTKLFTNVNNVTLNFVKINHFKVRTLSHSGRNVTGRIVVRHRKKNNVKSFFFYFLSFLSNNQIGLIVDLVFNKKRTNNCSIIKFSNNSFVVTKTTTLFRIGFYLTFFFGFKLKNNESNSIITYLGFCKNMSLICNLINKQFSVVSIATASGSFCQVLSVFFEKHFVLLCLPSGKKKLYKKNLVCFLGKSGSTIKKHLFLGLAGLNNKNGWRPEVRGVAMNPVDHPHGGRTKTNSPEVSPWGWVTKYSK